MKAASAPSGCGAVISLLRESGREKEGGVCVWRVVVVVVGGAGDVAAAKSQLQRNDKD